jgi:hypothetical protein
MKAQSVEEEADLLTERLYNAALSTPHQLTQNFLAFRKDILQSNGHAGIQLRNRLKKEVTTILKELYGRK